MRLRKTVSINCIIKLRMYHTGPIPIYQFMFAPLRTNHWARHIFEKFRESGLEPEIVGYKSRWKLSKYYKIKKS